MGTVADAKELRTVLFDVFGTVVDWYGTILAEGARIDSDKLVDWNEFARDWLIGYRSRVEAVRSGQRPWSNLDRLLGEAFEDLRQKHHLQRLDPPAVERLSTVWHRLDPWPDTLPALERLRKRFVLSAMSNANILLLADMARSSGLGWDCLMSAELVKKYKPADDIYRLAGECLGPTMDRVLYVAAHKWDLQAGQKAGFRSAYVRRWQLGPEEPPEEPDPTFDFVVDDLSQLAELLET